MVTDELTRLGPDKAAEKFGKNKQTVTVWMKTGLIPLAVAQQLLDEAGNAPTDTVMPEPAPAPQDVPETIAITSTSELEEVRTRLDKLENFARMMTDPDLRGHVSGVRPIQPVAMSGVSPIVTQVSGPQLGNNTTTACDIVGGPVSAPPVPASSIGEAWNAPYPQDSFRR